MFGVKIRYSELLRDGKYLFPDLKSEIGNSYKKFVSITQLISVQQFCHPFNMSGMYKGCSSET
jgi:hypothetical protein